VTRLLPQFAQGDIHANSINPGIKAGFTLERFDLLERRNECLLKHIFSVFIISQHTQA